MNSKYLLILIVAALLIVFCAVSATRLNNTNFNEAKEIIIMRQIGHEVLLQAGDSTSRVLPVKQVAANEYQIQFANHFTIKPDSLVNIIDGIINDNQLSSDYIVNVKECASNQVVFGYAMSETEKKNIIPCLRRQLSDNCYSINIAFPNNSLLGLPGKYLTAGIGLFALVIVFAGVKIYNNKKTLPANGGNSFEDNFISIGKYQFYHNKQYLINNNEHIKLTQKESKLLYIFACAPNEIIDRNRLQKEIWEDEGVIVGRSLDVFISKLRKKLEKDASVKVVNIHGKGYKLDIGS